MALSFLPGTRISNSKLLFYKRGIQKSNKWRIVFDQVKSRFSLSISFFLAIDRF